MDVASNTPLQTQLSDSQYRQTASSVLWGHLLHKHGPSQASSSPVATPVSKAHIPALAPQDKAAASTRILLHDTQAQLEKFAERTDRLTTGLENAKRELVTVQKLYEDEHEKLVERMIGLGAQTLLIMGPTRQLSTHLCM